MVLRALILAGVGAVVLGSCGQDDREPRAVTPAARGLTWTLPAGWHAGGRLTHLGGPTDALAAGSFPLRRGGECGPERARHDMPPTGALVWMVEYRRPSSRMLRTLPPRPTRFRLRGRAQSYECAGVGWNLSFQEHGRALQAFVALGARAGAARRAQALALLDSLAVGSAPPLPPDPYAGWRLKLNGVDSVRVPPGWRARAGHRPPGHRPPRTLFRVDNRRSPDALVRVEILERFWGPPSDRFVAVRGREPWFARWETPGGREVQRAGVGVRGHRFEAVITAGPAATAPDIEAAKKVARSLGVALWHVPDRFRDGG